MNKYNSPCDDDDIAEGKCYSGIARLTYALTSLECDVKIHAGDFVQGSVYDTIFNTDIAIDSYNWGGYDIVTLGNHEVRFAYIHESSQYSNASSSIKGRVLLSGLSGILLSRGTPHGFLPTLILPKHPPISRYTQRSTRMVFAMSPP